MSQLAMVTGAGRGLGREIVRQLAERGFAVIATARRLETVEPSRLGLEDFRGVETAELDIDFPGVPAQVEGILRGRPLDLLVLNAARFSPWDEKATSADLTSAREVLETNLFGSWAVVLATLPALRRARGMIIGVGSGSGSHSDPQFGLAVNPGAASYAVSKAAFHALLHRLSAELAPDGVRVFATEPGLTATSPGMEDFGARPVADGARSILTPLDGPVPSDSLLRDGAPLGW
ncbi:SDR family NAD(P)-dependent oxidoreductase [Microbacterium sp. E-13]|uniref:SDR family NAD(P)-dependent oxidoreductase n=1 Tax=Microbacterium sp. E-13 TaxID=3404048 RepID=UPI003CEE590C